MLLHVVQVLHRGSGSSRNRRIFLPPTRGSCCAARGYKYYISCYIWVRVGAFARHTEVIGLSKCSELFKSSTFRQPRRKWRRKGESGGSIFIFIFRLLVMGGKRSCVVLGFSSEGRLPIENEEWVSCPSFYNPVFRFSFLMGLTDIISCRTLGTARIFEQLST